MLFSLRFARMHAFNQSLRYDQRMYAVDIKGSIAYAKSLSRVGILTMEEETTIADGLRLVLKEWQDGTVCCVISSSGFSDLCHSLTFGLTTRISILPMKGDLANSSVPLVGSFTPDVRAMIKLRQTCASGCSKKLQSLKLAWKASSASWLREQTRKKISSFLDTRIYRSVEYIYTYIFTKILDLTPCSEANLSVGPTYCSRMHFPLAPIFRDFVSWFLGSQYPLLVAALSQEILLLLTGISLLRSLVSNLSLKIAYGGSVIAILSSNSWCGPVWRWHMWAVWQKILSSTRLPSLALWRWVTRTGICSISYSIILVGLIPHL